MALANPMSYRYVNTLVYCNYSYLHSDLNRGVRNHALVHASNLASVVVSLVMHCKGMVFNNRENEA